MNTIPVIMIRVDELMNVAQVLVVSARELDEDGGGKFEILAKIGNLHVRNAIVSVLIKRLNIKPRSVFFFSTLTFLGTAKHMQNKSLFVTEHQTCSH